MKKILILLCIIFSTSSVNAKMVTEYFGEKGEKHFTYDDEITLVLSPLAAGKTYYLPGSKDPIKYLGTYPGRYNVSKLFKLNDNEIIYFDVNKDTHIWSNGVQYKFETQDIRSGVFDRGIIYTITKE